MLLKSIDLQGYKTFAGRTVFEFAGAITCIVGPNGSGKSNIADAIRWVLGEQSYSLLRGKKTEDMIFSGSDSRSRAGMASSNIIFDNTAGWLPIDFSEVSITRRAYRDGRNEYLINGQRTRLKDITELLGSSGLSERTYTIIGQGLVDAALALRVEERRRLFEEAAGIGIFRARRREARRRLETTRRNLERVEDILTELKPRVKSLERQARRAAQFDQVENDLKVLLRDYYGYHWYKAQVDLSSSREVANVEEKAYEKVQRDQEGLNEKLISYREKIHEFRTRLSSWHQESAVFHNLRGEITRDLAVNDERIRSLENQKQETTQELVRLERQVSVNEKRLGESSQKVADLKGELDKAKSKVEEAVRILNSRQDDYFRAEKSYIETHKQISDFTDKLNRLKVRKIEKFAQEERQRSTICNVTQSIKVDEDALDKIRTKLESETIIIDQLIKERQKVEVYLKDLQEKLQINRNIQSKIQAERNIVETDLARLTAQITVLNESEKNLIGYEKGTKLILNKLKDNDHDPSKGIFGGLLQVPDEFELAIVSALGEYIDAVFSDDSKFTEEALEILLKNKTRGALLPIGSIQEIQPISTLGVEGAIGVASKVVKAPRELQPAVDLLLGQTFIIENRRTAQEILRGKEPSTRAVTLRGEVFHAGGQISVGKFGTGTSLSRPREKRKLTDEIENGEQKAAALDEKSNNAIKEQENLLNEESGISDNHEKILSQLNEVEDECKALVSEKNQILHKIEWQQRQELELENDLLASQKESIDITEEITNIESNLSSAGEILAQKESIVEDLSAKDLESKMASWNAQYSIAEQALASAEIQLNDRQVSLNDTKLSCEKLNAKVSSFNLTLTELESRNGKLQSKDEEIADKIEGLKALIDPIELELSEAEKHQNDLQINESEARLKLGQFFRQFSKSQLELSRQEERFENLRNRIENDLGLVMFEYEDDITGPTPLPMREVTEKLPRISKLPPDIEREIRRQRTQVKRMGAINPDAQAEYREVKERFDFMTAQVDDLHTAEKDINAVIDELDTIMEREFIKTFHEVADEFKVIFSRLFGGGSAQLILTDPNNITETGIDIEARLPGRRNQGLSLLSGGERSLTATALVFSLLKVSPTPFCVLDEVDAMLDEANVGRFRDLLRELAENTQFIVITHNRNTVQAADVIYGVTMGRDTASQVVSLKLDEVSKIV